MSSSSRTSADLDDLREMSKPQANDDAQTVAFRSVVRATIITIANQHVLEDKFAGVEAALKGLEGVAADSAEFKELHKLLAPPEDPSRHVVVRLRELEDSKRSVMGFLKTHSGTITLALVYGGYQLLTHLK